MSPKFPRKFNGLYKQINIYLWHTKMEYDNFQTIRIEKKRGKKSMQLLWEEGAVSNLFWGILKVTQLIRNICVPLLLLIELKKTERERERERESESVCVWGCVCVWVCKIMQLLWEEGAVSNLFWGILKVTQLIRNICVPLLLLIELKKTERERERERER